MLNDQDKWNDYRFVELEAKVEADGRRKTFSIIPFLHPTRSGLKSEKSLSKALMSSVDPIILLEGEPGSGKSVALRHVAQKMAACAKKMRSTKSIIPIYVNLKLLERESGEKIDRDLIESFVRKSLQRNDRKIEKFLDDEFDIGIQNDTWFFLFDSFDELPEVLSSIEVDNKIKDYRQAIDDFLHGMGQWRGVVASRPYHGPVGFGWPRFRVLPLTQTRQLELIRNANFKPEMEQEIIGQLGNAQQAIRSMASNPFYLMLLYKHIEAHLSDIPPDIAQGIRDALIELAASKRLKKEKYATQAHLRRIPQSANFLWAMQLLLRIPSIDIGLQIILPTVLCSKLISLNIIAIWYSLIRWHNLNLFLSLLQFPLLFFVIFILYMTLRTLTGSLHNKSYDPPIIGVITIIRTTLNFLLAMFGFMCIIEFYLQKDPSMLVKKNLSISIVATFAATLYATAFGPFAFRAARTGNFVRPRLWVFLPIWALIYMIIHPRCLIKPLYWLGFLIAILILTIWILFNVFLVQIGNTSSFLIRIVTTALLLLEFGIIFVIIVFPYFIKPSFLIILKPILWIYNWLQWYIWLRNHEGQINHQELCEIVSAYHLMSYRVKILKVIRQQRLLRMTPEAEAFLIQITIDMETTQQMSKQKKDQKALKSYLSSSINFNSLKGYNKLVSQANPEILDEFSKLLEDMRVLSANALF
ncbi:MAG TPA: NACHT domain-containing protein [Ktedonobacteraceae bacterium]|nr:NACHT domain-containing protein [Ktedonobacteraceae bacterium]